MKKRVLSLLLACAVAVTGIPALNPAVKAEAKAKEGSVLNIYTWNEEFKTIVENHYPGYKDGKIGDVSVNWVVVPSDSGAYQDNLDMTLLNQNALDADDRVDMFLVEPDYALKYLDSDYVLPVSKLGIKKSSLKNQYKYTWDLGSDSKGNLKALTWQCCPGVMIYNREIAKEVLGTDDPKKVQKYVSSWDKYNQTAKKVAKKGYKMTATAQDTYRVYADNIKTPWVKKGALNVDKNVEAWVKDSKELIDAGATTSGGMWFEEWMQGFYGGVFCYFGPAWFVNFCMDYGWSGDSVANDGGWAVTEGPQNFFWGSSLICAAEGTDNPTLVAKIMKTLTCDAKVMKDIATDEGDFVNNNKTMAAISKAGYKSEILGGQNPLPVYMNCAKKLRYKNLSAYDTACDNGFQSEADRYFKGYVDSYAQLKKNFYTYMEDLYPELKGK